MMRNAPHRRFFDDRAIAERILHGDETALRQFYSHFVSRLACFIRRRISNENDAEEVLQDTFLAGLESLRDFSFRSSLFTYLCSIANHKVIDYYRKKKLKHVVFSHLGDVEYLLSTLFGPEDAFNEQMLRQNIRDTFARITPAYQRILQLKYIYGYSVSEIARKLSISFKSAESQLFRARKAFASAYTS